MKMFFILVLLSCGFSSYAQVDEGLLNSMKAFHQALVNKDGSSIAQYTHKNLSYGHSNGWIETKTEMISNLQTEVISYSRFKEDSVTVVKNRKMASIRFIGDLTATLGGKTVDYHLKVLEVWVKKGKRWLLFARQALK